jgi:excisionase family DNA binding protein
LSDFPISTDDDVAVDDLVASSSTPSDLLLLRVETAAARLSISRAQVFRLIADDRLASVKIGSSRRVPVAALQDFVTRLLTEQA